MSTKDSRTIKVQLNRMDFDNILEWYRASHHGFGCGYRVVGCHKTKRRILSAVKQLMALRENRNRKGG